MDMYFNLIKTAHQQISHDQNNNLRDILSNRETVIILLLRCFAVSRLAKSLKYSYETNKNDAVRSASL